ncbi:MAG TPA: hypothetical protein VFJ70_08435 [Burkholderiales bacterium]|nr:hypothetical protein [Burkholderiales bacterium]
MPYRLLIATALIGLLCACASSPRDPTLAQAAPKPVAPAHTDEWMDRDYNVEGLIPPMERGRQVNEQDCGQPVDPRAGNLRCK